MLCIEFFYPDAMKVKCTLFVTLQKNTGQNGGKPKLDLNVEAAWAQGITGKNVTTAIMDDGVDYMHPDLKFNYVSKSFFYYACPVQLLLQRRQKG